MIDNGAISENLKHPLWYIHHGALANSASSPPTILLPVYDISSSFSFLSSLLIFSNKGRTPHSDKRQFNLNYQLIIQDLKPLNNIDNTEGIRLLPSSPLPKLRGLKKDFLLVSRVVLSRPPPSSTNSSRGASESEWQRDNDVQWCDDLCLMHLGYLNIWKCFCFIKMMSINPNLKTLV